MDETAAADTPELLQVISQPGVLSIGPSGFAGTISKPCRAWRELVTRLSIEDWVHESLKEYSPAILRGYAAMALAKKIGEELLQQLDTAETEQEPDELNIDPLKPLIPLFIQAAYWNSPQKIIYGCIMRTENISQMYYSEVFTTFAAHHRAALAELIVTQLVQNGQKITSFAQNTLLNNIDASSELRQSLKALEVL